MTGLETGLKTLRQGASAGRAWDGAGGWCGRMVRADGPSGLIPLLGDLVRDEREWQGFTQAQLAAAARVSVRMLIRFDHESLDDIGLGEWR